MNKLLAMGTKFSVASRYSSTSVTTMRELPPKVRRLILNNLSWTDTLSARLVCRQWFIDVNHHSRMFGIIDSTDVVDDVLAPQDLEFDSHCVKIISLTSPQTQFVESLFPHPTNIHLLIIGEISLDHLLTLLKYFPALDKLKLCTNKILSVNKGKNEEWHQKDSSLLPKSLSLGDFVESQILTKISIRGPCGDSVEKLMCPSRKIFRRILASKFPSLKTFDLINVECNQYDEPSYTILLLVFIGNHRSTLKNLFIRMTSVPLVNSSKCQLLSVGLPQELLIPDEAIEETKLSKLVIEPLASGIGGIHWLNLMHEQNSLEKLHGSFLAAPFSLYRSVINRNFKTLVAIQLTHLSLCEPSDPDPTHIRPLRLSLFLKCSVLKSLTLERFDQDPVTLESSDCSSEITNTNSLPASLETFKVSGFRILQQDILELSTGILPNLKSLTLINCGRSSNCGVHVSTLQTILNNSNRMKLEYFCVRPIAIFTAADVERLEHFARIIGQPLESFFFLKGKKIEWRPKSSEETFPRSQRRSFEPKTSGNILWLLLNLNNIRARVGRSFLNTMREIFR